MSEETNQIEKTWNGRVYTPRYVEVMEYAQDLAKGRDELNFDDLVTVYDLLTAVCAVHPEAFSELLGKNCAVFNYNDFIAELYGIEDDFSEEDVDDEIACILAHEMGHIVLGHRGDGNVDYERAADSFALSLMRKAGFDSSVAIEFWSRYYERIGWWGGTGSHMEPHERIEFLKAQFFSHNKK